MSMTTIDLFYYRDMFFKEKNIEIVAPRISCIARRLGSRIVLKSKTRLVPFLIGSQASILHMCTSSFCRKL